MPGTAFPAVHEPFTTPDLHCLGLHPYQVADATLGYPSLYFVKSADVMDGALEAMNEICKYGGICVLPVLDPALMASLMTLRLNIYTDPQKPIQVEPKIYPVGEPSPDALDFLTERRDEGVCRDGQSPLFVDGLDRVFRAHHRLDALADVQRQDVSLSRRDFFAENHLEAIAMLQVLRAQRTLDGIVVRYGNYLQSGPLGHVIEHSLHGWTAIGMARVDMKIGSPTMAAKV